MTDASTGLSKLEAAGDNETVAPLPGDTSMSATGLV